MKRVSKHISYKEATHSTTAKNEKIVNKPSSEDIKNMELIASKVFEPLREWVGEPIYVNSFFRSEKLNKRIKGAPHSQHKTGNAFDITLKDSSKNIEIFNYIKDSLDFDQLIWELGSMSPQWIHVSYVSESENRRQILITRGKRIYREYGCSSC